MLRIAGELVNGGVQVAINSEADARLMQEETQASCMFVATCGCGRFKLRGHDGVKIYREAQKHFEETGHKCFGHFMFGISGRADGDREPVR